MTTPVSIPIPIPAPDGSSSSDTNYVIPANSLDLLANDTKSSLLAVSNLGSSITSRISSTLDLIENLTGFETFVVDATPLNNLSDASASTALSDNISGSTYTRIVIILGEITPIGTATIVISNGTTSYELSVPTTTSEKRLLFNNIPSSFVSSFYLQNNTGTTLASWGNSIVVVGL